MNAEAFKDKIVLIGATASGLHDRVSTPLGEVVPGVMVHAYAVEQILDGRSAYRPGELHGIEIIVVALLGLILMIGFSMLAFKRSLAMFIVMEVGVLGAAVLLYNGSGVVMHPMYPALSLFFLYAVLVFIRADHMTRS